MQNKQNRGCWNGVYRYKFNLYRYKLPTAQFGTRCTGTRSTCTGTCWPPPIFAQGVPIHVQPVPVHVLVSCLGCWDFCIFTHFSSTNLLQYIPYQKSTMESHQNNSKSGLYSIKIHFPQVRTFLPKNQNHKR